MTIHHTYENNFANRIEMINDQNNPLNVFCLAGINYRKSDVTIRGKFSISTAQSQQLLEEAAIHLSGCFILSTCNRTEIYGISDNVQELVELLCKYTNGTIEEFKNYGYVKEGIAATEHLFKVSSGLDSQIIGDNEILSQLKIAARLAKQYGCLNSFTERVVNYAIQASKEIKTKTKLSSGSVSVSYAAVEIIKEKIGEIKTKKVLIVGSGKIGNHVGKNLKNYLPDADIYFTNRTDKRAFELAQEYDAGFVPYKNLDIECNLADIIIVSSSADSYTITSSFFIDEKPRLILDLSVPQNVDPAVKGLPGLELMNVDEISLILDKTILLRKAEIPKAIAIIKNTIADMMDWHRRQSNNPLLRKVKLQLYELTEAHFNNILHEENIHKTVSSLAVQLHNQNNKGCQCIHALSSYLHMSYDTTS